MSAAVWVWVNPSLSISISNQLVSLSIEILYKPILKSVQLFTVAQVRYSFEQYYTAWSAQACVWWINA